MSAAATTSADERASSGPSLSDRQLALAIGVSLFVLVGWPLLFVRIPP